jgi:hypothetical protein
LAQPYRSTGEFWSKKKGLGNISKVHWWTQFLMLISTSLSVSVGFYLNLYFSDENLLNISEIRSKSCRDNSKLKIAQVTRIFRVSVIYDFVASDQHYRLVWNKFKQLLRFYPLQSTRSGAQPGFWLIYYWPPMMWRIQEMNHYFWLTVS